MLISNKVNPSKQKKILLPVCDLKSMFAWVMKQDDAQNMVKSLSQDCKKEKVRFQCGLVIYTHT